MSKKTEILVAGVVSAALFTGFTSYSYFSDKATAKAAAKQVVPTGVVSSLSQAPQQKVSVKSTATVATTVQKPTMLQTQVDAPPDSAQTAPAVPAPAPNKKTTKSKAS